MNRAYSFLDVKSVNEEKRTIEGWATTPSTDRMGDIVEPLGAEFASEIPSLWQHYHDEPVGHTYLGRPTPKGIPFKIQLASTDEPGLLKDVLDKAWQSVKLRLVRAVSIGFRAIEWALMDGGGVRFLKYEIMELSLVTIPANSDCTITSIKHFDAEYLAASGRKTFGANPPGATGTQPVKVTINPERKAIRKGGLFDSAPKEGKSMSTVSQEITDWQNELKVKNLKIEELRADSKGETFDESVREELKGLIAEAKSIKENIAILSDIEGLTSASTAKAVTGITNAETAAAARSGVQFKAQPKLAPGVGFARIVKARAAGIKLQVPAYVVAEKMWGSDNETAAIMKSAVAAGSTVSGNWAAYLTGADTAAFADFAEYLRNFTILGKFGTGNIPALNAVAFDEPLITETGAGSASWTGEGKPLPLTSGSGTRTTLTRLKLGSICALTDESVMSSSPSSDLVVRNMLIKALAERLDIDFINPAKAASSGVSPASITNGVSATHSAGTDADGVRADIKAAMAKFIAAKNPPTSGVWIMSSTTALTLSLMVNAMGSREFPDITMYGGSLAGLPVIASEYVPSVTAGTYLVLANAGDIFLGDEDGVEVDVSTETSLEMLDGSLTQDAGAGTGASLVSMFQTDGVAIRAKRIINWLKRRSSAVAVIDQVAYALS